MVEDRVNGLEKELRNQNAKITDLEKADIALKGQVKVLVGGITELKDSVSELTRAMRDATESSNTKLITEIAKIYNSLDDYKKHVETTYERKDGIAWVKWTAKIIGGTMITIILTALLTTIIKGNV